MSDAITFEPFADPRGYIGWSVFAQQSRSNKPILSDGLRRVIEKLTIERTIYIRVNDRLTKNGQACFYLVFSRDGAVGVCLGTNEGANRNVQCRARARRPRVRGSGRGHHGKRRPTRAGRQIAVCHAGRAGDSTFSPSAASPNHITPDAFWREQPSITPNAFGCRAVLDPVSRRRKGVRAKFASVRTRTLARRLPELTFSAR